jgi:surface antigen
MSMRKTICAAALAATLAACQAPGDSGLASRSDPSLGSSTTTGALLGGIAGGVAGSRFGGGAGKLVATGAGALGGALLGGMLGRAVEPSDEAHAQAGTVRALEETRIGETVTWNNPGTGSAGTVTPTGQYTDASGRNCREFRQSVNVGGRIEEAVGTACEQPDGRWRIAS